MDNILVLKNVSKNYGSFELQNINLSLKENSITGFIGKNGAGKSTTIKAIIGLIKLDSGEIEYFDNPLLSTKEIKNKIGVVLDGGYFYDTLTLNQMKDLIASTYDNWDEHKFAYYLNRFDLNGNQVINTLSKGMTMKYSLSLALSHNADLLIMDEPTSGLDPEIRKELMDILKEYVAEEGNSVLFSTHITSDLEQSADEIIIIDKGVILEQVGKDELLESYRKLREMLKP